MGDRREGQKQELETTASQSSVSNPRRDPVDVAEEFVAAALTGKEWECRDNYPSIFQKCWVERGTTANGDWERFIDQPLSALEACKIEELLAVARGYRSALEAILSAYHGRAFHDPDELQLLPFQMKELALIALATPEALALDNRRLCRLSKDFRP